MKRKLLAVRPHSLNYLEIYEVSSARSFDEAKRMIVDAEAEGVPFDALDLPVRDEKAFWAFLEWMRDTHRRYPFSIFDYGSNLRFLHIRDRAAGMGFVLRT